MALSNKIVGLKSERLLEIASDLVSGLPAFFEIQGPSVGDRATSSFMRELRLRCAAAFDADFAEQRICGENGLTVDYYFPDEGAIVEIALSLKAIMARDAGHPVQSLVFITKPGGAKRCGQPGARAMIEWAARAHSLTVTIRELVPSNRAVD